MSPTRKPGVQQPDDAHSGRAWNGAKNLDDEGIVDHHLCLFEFMGQAYELRFHPRPDRQSPFTVVSADATRRRYYLRVIEGRKVMQAMHGTEMKSTERTPFDDICFRLVYVGEFLPRFTLEADETKWCACPRVKGLHPSYFCHRIVVPNWSQYWCWRDSVAKHLVATKDADRVSPGYVVDTDGARALDQAQDAYEDLPPLGRQGPFSRLDATERQESAEEGLDGERGR